jgi:hypothetical protein
VTIDHNIGSRATFGHVTYEDGYVYPVGIQILGYLITGCTLIWIPVKLIFVPPKNNFVMKKIVDADKTNTI